jgi:hypothetical protein
VLQVEFLGHSSKSTPCCLSINKATENESLSAHWLLVLILPQAPSGANLDNKELISDA